jgi:translation elongation factor EF-1alpha
MECSEYEDNWFSHLPNEILIAVLDSLDRFQLNRVVRVDKRIRELAQFILEHRKKIRLCGEDSRVLVLSLPSEYDAKKIKSAKIESTDLIVSRGFLAINTFFSESPTTHTRYYHKIQNRERSTSVQVVNGGKGVLRRITMIEPPIEQLHRLKLYTSAYTADLCLLIVDPEEIGEYSEDIKELIFGCCFMMSSRNVIVAIDLSNCSGEHPQELLQIFNKSKAKIATLLDKTVGLCYSITPINVQTGCNIAAVKELPKYDWFSGRSLKTLVLEDQLRTNFDESAYKKLCEAPFRMQFTNCFKIGGIGTVIEGRVLSGILQAGCVVCIHPRGLTTEVRSLERYWEHCKEAKPGSAVAVNVVNISIRELSAGLGYIVNKKQTPLINCTIAFRARIAVMKPDRFAQHHSYTVFYGSSRIPCIVWWIFSDDGKSYDKSERQFKVERKMPDIKKPVKKGMRKKEYETKLLEYAQAIERLHSKAAKEEHVKFQMEKAAENFQRLPKNLSKKATAILLPLIHFDIEEYKPTEFEKNFAGKLMIMEKRSIVGVGRVDRIIQNSAQTFKVPVNADYKKQYAEVVDRAEELFKLPAEQKLHKLFMEHVTNNEHAKKCILNLKLLSAWQEQLQRNQF